MTKISPSLYIASAFLAAALLHNCAAHAGGPGPVSKRAVCCNEYDGTQPQAIWEVTDGSIPNVHYKVKLEGYWVNVPDDAVLNIPSTDGISVVWYSSTRYGNDQPPSFFIRCFLPGALF